MSISGKYRPYYTYEDYCLWEGQWELIEVMLYAMAPMPESNIKLLVEIMSPPTAAEDRGEEMELYQSQK